jgi:chromate reductase, NAD(P)H dehydrogenase (quinone)
VILLVSGSLRSGSTNTALLRTAHDLEADSVLFDGLDRLPHFNPDDDYDPLPPAVVELRALIAQAHAILFCTPEYAGALPGSFKNLLEWTVGGGEIYRKPVAWINVVARGRGENADESLRRVLGYVGAEIVEDACVRIPVAHQDVGEDGLLADPDVRAGIARSLAALTVSR